MPRSALGLDVGGANLKAAHSGGVARSRPFALWENPADLPDALRDLLRDWPPYDVLAVTMTGELCDCFATKREGVRAILDAVSAVAGSTPLRVWLVNGRLADLAAARADPLARGLGELDRAGDVRRSIRPAGAGAADRRRLDHHRRRPAARRPAGAAGPQRHPAHPL